VLRKIHIEKPDWNLPAMQTQRENSSRRFVFVFWQGSLTETSCSGDLVQIFLAQLPR